jgi:hypothetical protein
VGIFILCSIHLQALPLVAFFAGILSIRIAHQHWIFNKNTFLIFLFSIGSILFGIWQAQTEPTTMHNQSWQSINWLRAIPIALANQCKAFCPVPNFTSSHVWNTLLLDIPFVLLYSIFFVVVFIIFYNWHWRDKLIFCIAVVVNVLLLAYFNGWGIRHGCFLWLLVFFGFCLQSIKSKWANYLITIILAIQAIAGCILFYLDAIHPFSSSKHVGDFIKKNYSKSYVIGAHHYTIEPISFYLQQPIYHLTVHKQVYQLQWKEENFTNNFSYAEIDSIVKHNPNTICILSKAIPDSLKNAIIKSPACNFNSILVFSAPNSIVKDESYEIWKLNAKIP